MFIEPEEFARLQHEARSHRHPEFIVAVLIGGFSPEAVACVTGWFIAAASSDTSEAHLWASEMICLISEAEVPAASARAAEAVIMKMKMMAAD